MRAFVNGNLTSKSQINLTHILMLTVGYITYRGDYITLPFWFLFIIRSGIENDRAVAPYSSHAHPMCICGVWNLWVFTIVINQCTWLGFLRIKIKTLPLFLNALSSNEFFLTKYYIRMNDKGYLTKARNKYISKTLYIHYTQTCTLFVWIMDLGHFQKLKISDNLLCWFVFKNINIVFTWWEMLIYLYVIIKYHNTV